MLVCQSDAVVGGDVTGAGDQMAPARLPLCHPESDPQLKAVGWGWSVLVLPPSQRQPAESWCPWQPQA